MIGDKNVNCYYGILEPYSKFLLAHPYIYIYIYSRSRLMWSQVMLSIG